jgi:16S rRNA (cytidine1402-2'-O)-methyltransferase
VRGTLGELRDRYRDQRPLGEVTLVVSGADAGSSVADAADLDDALAEQATQLLAAGRSARDVADQLASESGRPRRQIYAIVTKIAALSDDEVAPPVRS